MDDDDDTLRKYAGEVRKLLDLYRRAQVTLDRSALRDFNLQYVLVDALTAIAIIPITRAGEEGVPQ